MAITSNTYTGNGSNTLFSFTFPYLETSDIDVYINGVLTTAYTFANETTIQMNTAPANGATILINRSTDDTELQATFFPGSSIKASDLNLDFNQALYINQETANASAAATSTANTALTNSNTAISTANSAVSTANTAVSTANSAVSTANTASTTASSAVSTANTASSNASAAVSTANAASAAAASAVSTANSAVSAANSAVSTANSALTTANNAVTTANTADTNASAAVSTANTASSDASTAISTANTAIFDSSSALLAANDAATDAANAVSTANAAAAAVANALLFTIVANVAAIPASPSNNDAIEITDSTGIESFTPLINIPVGYVGDPGLSVKLIYDGTALTWTWIQYYPNNSETRYLKLVGGTLTGQLLGDNSTSPATPGFAFDGDANTGIYSPGADQVAISTNGTGRLFVDASGNVGIGAAPTAQFDVAAATPIVRLTDVGGNAYHQLEGTGNGSLRISADEGNTGTNTSTILFNVDGSEKLRITSDGKVGLGTTSPSYLLQVSDKFAVDTSNTFGRIYLQRQTGNSLSGMFIQGADVANTANDLSIVNVSGGGSTIELAGGTTAAAIKFFTNTYTTERARIDSSGRLLVGTSTSTGHVGGTQSNLQLSGTSAAAASVGLFKQSADTFGSFVTLSKARSGPAIVSSGDQLGGIYFNGHDGVDYATSGAVIEAYVDGTPGANKMPGRLVFSTATNASPSVITERMRIGSAGQIGLGGANYGTSGQVLTSNGSSSAPTWQTIDSFPAGTAMLFVQTAAPTGWTKSTTHNNKALRVVSGSAGSGGTTAFTSVFASRTPAGTVGSTTLTESQIPAHDHLAVYATGTSTSLPSRLSILGGVALRSTTLASATADVIEDAGSGGSHNHSFTGTAMDFAVQYVDVIIATKN